MFKPRQTMWRLLAVVTAAIVPLAFWLLGAPADAQSTAADSATAAEFAAVAPDLALVVTGLDDDGRRRAVERLGAVDGVDRATFDLLGDDQAVFYLARSGSSDGSRPIDAVASQAVQIVSSLAPESEVLVGGSAMVDRALADRFGNTVNGLLLLAAAAGAALGAIFGWKRGLATAIALVITVYCAGNIGSQVGGRFDGTMTTTALPGALAGLLVGATLSVRLLIWFRRPRGADGAEQIRRAIADLIPEAALVLCGLIVSSVLIELLDPGRSPFTVVTISGIVAAVVLVAVLAPGLAVLVGQPERASWLPLSLPDGRDFPLLILLAVGVALIGLSLFAIGQPSSALLSSDRLGVDSEPALVAERLRVGGGDATTALVATKPEGTTQTDFEGWVGVIVERPEVARVDVGSGRYLPTGRVEVDQATSLIPDRAPGVAVIVLNVPPRSETGQGVAARLGAIPLAGGPPTFFGGGVDAAQVAGSRSSVIMAVLILAAAAAAGVYVLTQNVAQSVVALLLRILGGGASVGVYRLLASEATMAEILTMLVVIGLGLGLFELEFLRRLTDGRTGVEGEDGHAANPGQYAAIGLGLIGLSGLIIALASWFGGGPGTGRFGLGLLAAVAVELLAGLLLLRPALLGQRAAFHTAVRPVRIALHSGGERQAEATVGPEDPTWRRVVGDLLQAEFRLQSQPVEADLEAVFVRDTPLFRQADSHHTSLAGAGLRIVGRSPRLRSLKTVSGRSPITLAVTVDHPERQLVDGEGTVVGVRKPERRSGVLWLSEETDGSFRIAESVELGSVPLPNEHGPVIDADRGPPMEEGQQSHHGLAP